MIQEVQNEILTFHFLDDEGDHNLLQIFEDGGTELYGIREQIGEADVREGYILMSVKVEDALLMENEKDLLEKAKDNDVAGAFEIIGEMECIQGIGTPATLCNGLMEDPSQAKQIYDKIIGDYKKLRSRVAN